MATVALLEAWGLAADGVSLLTTSGCDVFARSARSGQPPVLRGEGRIVFTGVLRDLVVL